VPELPETTVISEDVAALAGGREVLRAAVFRPDVTNVEPEEFSRRLVGRRLRGTGRRGKVIVLDFGDVVGLVHLVISGRVLRLDGWREPDRIHTAVLEFEGEDEPLVLAFTRLWLGYFDLYEPGQEEKHPLISRLGPDPFSEEFTVEYLASTFRRKASIKGLLLDQSVVAGLGNIYVDEALWYAAAQLMLQKEPRKLLIVLTDGDPSRPANVKRLVGELESRGGIEIFGVGIATMVVKSLFRSYRVINDVRELRTALFEIARAALLAA